jgi:hypothetical protein
VALLAGLAQQLPDKPEQLVVLARVVEPEQKAKL